MRISPRILAALLAVSGCWLTAHAANNPVELSGWGQSFWQAPDGAVIDTDKTGIKVTTDKGVVADGNASLHLFIESQMDNLNLQAAQTVSALETGKTYILTGKFNVPSSSWRYRVMFGNESLVTIGEVVDKLGEWADLEYVFEFNKTSKDFRIQSCGTGDMYADNVSLREVIYGEDGVTVTGYGEELLVNGDFEDNLDLKPPAEISNAAVTNMDQSAEIKWNNPLDKDFKFAYVYDITDGKEVLVCTTADGKYNVSGLRNGKIYTLLIRTADENGNRSEGVTVEVAPVASPVKHEMPEFYINDIGVNSLASGTLKAQMRFKNNSMPEDYSAELILVLLKDGELCDMASGYAIISPTAEDAPYTSISVELEVPEGEGYSAALYVWDSLTGMEAIEDAVTLE